MGTETGRKIEGSLEDAARGESRNACDQRGIATAGADLRGGIDA